MLVYKLTNLLCKKENLNRGAIEDDTGKGVVDPEGDGVVPKGTQQVGLFNIKGTAKLLL